MQLRLPIILFICFLFSVFSALKGQEFSNLRTGVFQVDSTHISLDSLSIIPQTFEAETAGISIDSALYTLNLFEAKIIFHKSVLGKKVKYKYRVFPLNFSQPFALRDTSIIRKKNDEYENYFELLPEQTSETTNLFGGMYKSGSLSRGISFGNSQDLSVNSNLNLQLNGKLNERFHIIASISDDNIPIQPQGNTAQIQEFDKVFIKIYDDKTSLIAGDFQVKQQDGYFLKYNKKAQGAFFEQDYTLKNSSIKANLRAGAALSKGKFARNQFNGIEGNQGPYKLTGAENEQFVVVLSGTEVVYINGEKLKRGFDNDYIIDYNAAEITFTTKRFITKDSRIIVEHQYSDKNYARSLLQFSNSYKAKNWSAFVSAYGEQDSKNQPLQQSLSLNEIQVLQGAGDNIDAAFVNSIDSVEFTNNQVLYALKDSLGYDSIFVHSTNENEAFYRPIFTNVGMGNGDYISNEFTANGRVYSWVKPDTIGSVIVRNGEFQPVKVLVAPQKKQVLSAGGEWNITRGLNVKGEWAISNTDINTFSEKNNDDNLDWAGKWGFTFNQLEQNKERNWGLISTVSWERTEANFNAIERYRDVEFTRNWNTKQLNIKSAQNIVQGEIGVKSKDWGTLKYNYENYNVAHVFNGSRHSAIAQIENKHWIIESNSGLMQADGDNNSSYLRHKGKFAYKMKYTVLGFENELENNTIYTSSSRDTISAASFQFHDWTVFLASADSLKNRYKVYFRGRDDFKPKTELFGYTSQVSEYGFELALKRNKNHQINLLAANRVLDIKDTSLTNQSPENTLISRLDYQFKWWKGAVTGNTFYEVGGGLERKKEFIYLEVPAGQGVYVWIDYNNDDVKDLGEFEIAQYTYEANYIRTFIQSNEYVRIFTNGFNQNISIQPKVLLTKNTGWQKWLGRFSNQSSLRMDRKTNLDDFAFTANPFAKIAHDTVLVSLNQSVRSTVFYNRANPDFNLRYTYSNLNNKILLANGFETRANNTHEGNIHLKLGKQFFTDIKNTLSEKSNQSDFLSSRNYTIQSAEVAPEISWQKASSNRVTLKSSYSNKKNIAVYAPEETKTLGGEKAEALEVGIEWQNSQAEKGLWRANLNFVNIDYNGSANSSLGYEMLNGLQAGNNYTWGISLQKTLASNLQITIAYNGRKPDGLNTIHNGSLQARAFF